MKIETNTTMDLKSSILISLFLIIGVFFPASVDGSRIFVAGIQGIIFAIGK